MRNTSDILDPPWSDVRDRDKKITELKIKNASRTREYVFSQTSRLWQLMGEHSFWVDPERAQRGLQAILFLWSRCKEITEADESLLHATCDEYNRRLAHTLTTNKRKEKS